MAGSILDVIRRNYFRLELLGPSRRLRNPRTPSEAPMGQNILGTPGQSYSPLTSRPEGVSRIDFRTNGARGEKRKLKWWSGTDQNDGMAAIRAKVLGQRMMNGGF